MSLFSLFGGKKREGLPDADAGDPRATASEPAASTPPDGVSAAEAPAAAPAAAATVHASLTAETHAPTAGQSPFQAPEAWNVDALTQAPPAPATEPVDVGPRDAAITAELQPGIVETLKTVYDPEIPVDIYELGLIYDIAADADRRVKIMMTLTSPACPSAQQLPSEVRWKVKAVPGVSDAAVEIVWEPPWDKDRMSEAAKLQLGFF